MTDATAQAGLGERQLHPRQADTFPLLTDDEIRRIRPFGAGVASPRARRCSRLAGPGRACS